ncbi:MAG: hypothetical protein JNK05_18830 [Myxococcales bacterium]|nr:hypothetical protein [Myxococcales bacterium]
MNETLNVYARSHLGPEATVMALVLLVALHAWSWRFVLSRRREERRVAEDAVRRVSEPVSIGERSAIRDSIGGRTFEEEIWPRGYASAPVRRETNEPTDRRVWVRHVGGLFEDMNTLGRGVTVGQFQLLFAYAFAAMAVQLVRRTRVGQSDEPRSLVERGEGPLPEPSGERFSTPTP